MKQKKTVVDDDQKEDEFIKPTDVDVKKELSDPRLGVVTANGRKKKGGSFSNVGR